MINTGELKENVIAIQETIIHDFLSLPDDILNAKPDSKRWSILECVEHLNRYNGYYLPEIERALLKDRVNSPVAPHRSTWIGSLFIRMMHPQNQRKQKTFRRMDPGNSKLTREVLNRFLSDQRLLLSLLDDAGRSQLNRKSVRVEFFPLLRMNTGDALTFLIDHEQRHLLQALEARAMAISDPLLPTAARVVA